MPIKKLGIHLAPDTFKIVELEQKGNNLILLNWATGSYPFTGDTQEQSKFLSSVLKKEKIVAKEVNLVPANADIVYKLIELPIMPDKELAAALKYKLQKLLPYPAADAVIDYYRLKVKREGKLLFFVAAVPKNKVLQLQEIMKNAGLSLKAIIAPSSALGNVLTCPLEGTNAVVYLCQRVSIIIIVRDGQVVFARELQTGGDDITKSMVGMVQTEKGRLELDYEKAQKLRDAFGIPLNVEEYSKQAQVPGEEVLALMRPALEKMAAEVMDTFEYYRQEMGDEAEFSKIYLTGSGAQVKNLLNYFKDQLGIPFELLPLRFSASRVGFDKVAPVISLALGATCPGKETLQLLPPTQSRVLFVRRFNPRTAILAFFLILTFIFSWYSFKAGNLGATYKSLQKQHRNLKSKYDKMAAVSSKADIGRIVYVSEDRFVGILNQLDKITPKDVYLEKIQYDNAKGELVIGGVALRSTKLTNVPVLVKRLNQSDYFKTVVSSSLTETDLYTTPAYTFTVKCMLTEE